MDGLITADQLLQRGQPAQALRVLQAVLQRTPQRGPAHALCGVALSRLGQTSVALRSLRTAIECGVPQGNLAAFFVQTLAALPADPVRHHMADYRLAIGFLDGGGVDPVALAPGLWPALQGCAALRDWTAADSALPAPSVEATALLTAALPEVPVVSTTLEVLLVRWRVGVLRGTVTLPLELLAAIAAQAWLGEHPWAETVEDTVAVSALQQTIQGEIDRGVVDPARVLRFAMWRSLASLGPAPVLDACADPRVALLVRQQRIEPAVERALGQSLSTLTAVTGDTSAAVQAMYEENPYPRWQGLAQQPARGREAVVAASVPVLAPGTVDSPDPIDILVAGCGTGREALTVARAFRNSRVLAVDLSRRSLGYAARKADELGLRGTVSFAQADILQLGTLGRRFHHISSSGVLHHLADPMTGWRVLRGMLHPGGTMKVALYSEAARQPVVAARALIAEAGLAPTVDGLRAARQLVLAQSAHHPVHALVHSPDFASLSGVRDLLFHVQEHRMTMPQIAAMLDALDLRLLGLELPHPGMLARYRRLFPDDAAARDLHRWAAVEARWPDTFPGMITMWLKAA